MPILRIAEHVTGSIQFETCCLRLSDDDCRIDTMQRGGIPTAGAGAAA